MSHEMTPCVRACRALYALLLSQEVASASRAPMLFSLVWRAMQADPKAARVAAFAKRLLQLALVHPPSFACAALLLLSQLLQVPLLLGGELGGGFDLDNQEGGAMLRRAVCGGPGWPGLVELCCCESRGPGYGCR